jgi:hypothetical protein
VILTVLSSAPSFIPANANRESLTLQNQGGYPVRALEIKRGVDPAAVLTDGLVMYGQGDWIFSNKGKAWSLQAVGGTSSVMFDECEREPT